MAKSNELLAKSGKSHLSKEEKENLIKNTVKIENKKDKIIAPNYLTDEMKEKFYFLADELATIKIFTHLDVDSLAQYVFNLAKFEDASKILNSLDILDEDYEKVSKEQEKKFKMVKTGANELGLNVLTRSKLIVPVKEKKKNKFDKF
ncbi:MAG: P27 family phage terminase small subunit [Sarcina sp.]